MSLSARLRDGDLRALARLATYVENDDAIGRAALAALYPETGRAHVVGITGPPGAGKSTVINALIGYWRRHDRRIGVVAVDPTSPLSGGATLGDRIRMTERSADPNVFIRSMASRGAAGGLAAATAGVIQLLDAAGFDLVLVETVGVGQEEIAITRLTHTTLLVMAPGLGDGVQTMKAGILEVGDLLVVNKADRPGAEALARDLAQLVQHGGSGDASWQPPVVRVSATQGEGVDDLAKRTEGHLEYLRTSGELEVRRRSMVSAEIAGRLRSELERRLSAFVRDSPAYAAAVEESAARQMTPGTAANALLDDISRTLP